MTLALFRLCSVVLFLLLLTYFMFSCVSNWSITSNLCYWSILSRDSAAFFYSKAISWSRRALQFLLSSIFFVFIYSYYFSNAASFALNWIYSWFSVFSLSSNFSCLYYSYCSSWIVLSLIVSSFSFRTYDLSSMSNRSSSSAYCSILLFASSSNLTVISFSKSWSMPRFVFIEVSLSLIAAMYSSINANKSAFASFIFTKSLGEVWPDLEFSVESSFAWAASVSSYFHSLITLSKFLVSSKSSFMDFPCSSRMSLPY